MTAPNEETADAPKSPDVSADFAARLAHALRSPLGVIAQGLQELETGSDSPEIYLRLAQQSATRLLSLGQRLESVAQLKRGAPVAESTPAPLGTTVQRAVERAEDLVRRRGVSVRVVAEAEIDTARLAAPSAVSLAVEELVTNALRHAKTSVAVHLERERDGATIKVEHDGEPLRVMPDEDPFAPRPGKGSGLGIGLWLARTILRRADGELELAPDGALLVRVPLAP